jgi:hypothetical protein
MTASSRWGQAAAFIGSAAPAQKSRARREQPDRKKTGRVVAGRVVAGWLLLVGVLLVTGAPADAQVGPAGVQGGSARNIEGASGGAGHPCVAPGPHGFSDVAEGAYYDVAVGWLVEAGITGGTSPGKFSPSQPVTRAQMAVFLWRAAGSPTPVGSHGFNDVPSGAYYENAVTWLVEAGITGGTGPGKFSPSQPVTRAQMGVFLWGAAGLPTPVGSHGFNDIPSGAYYENAVIWLVGSGITGGTAPGKFGAPDVRVGLISG